MIQALLQKVHPFLSPRLPLLKVHLAARNPQSSRLWTACASIADPRRAVRQTNSDHGVIKDRLVPGHYQPGRFLISGVNEGSIQSCSLRAVPHRPRVLQLGACYLTAILVAHPLVHLPIEPGEPL